MAEALSENGAQLAVVARKQHELDATVAALADKGIFAKGFALNLSYEEAPAVLVESCCLWPD